MTHLARIATAALALVLAVLAPALVPQVAHAASDTVRDLDVTFAVQADGSLDVTYVLDWDFGEKGRRGIEFGIATRESWDQDASQDVVYEVSDLQVSSPSGAPATYTQTERDFGSDGQLMLRIGDPNQALDTETATYEISYTVHGAMRTFDGVPELNWDVTSRDYPPVENFTITVTGPEGVDRARCLAGDIECGQSVQGGVATLTGGGVEDGDPITAVAAFPAGSVQNAEPNLVERRLTSPELQSQDSTFTVGSDGVTSVEHTLVYALPDDADEERFDLRLDTRAPISGKEDRIWRVTELQATNEHGAPYEVETDVPVEGESEEALRIDVTAPVVPPTATVVVSYQVEGAVDSSNGEAVFRLPLEIARHHDELDSSFTWNFPGDVSSADCVRLGLDGEDRRRGCDETETLTVDGDSVTLDSPIGVSVTSLIRFEAVFPAAAVGDAAAIIEPSRDRARMVTAAGSTAAGLGGAGVMVAAGLLLRKRAGQPRDQRYSNVAPGLTDPGGNVVNSAGQPTVAVQFEPPEIDVATAGLFLDREFEGRHTAAILTQLAVRGAVELTSSPLGVEVADPGKAEPGLEQELVDEMGTRRSSAELLPATARALNRLVNSHQLDVVKDRRYFQASSSNPATRLRGIGVLVLGIALPIAAIILLIVGDSWILRFGGLGVAVGSIVGAVLLTSKKPTRSLGATGTALLDQIRGFRLYIETAEADKLDFEANRDIYTRYLPWAVLFGLTERWTRVCRELAAAGRIEPLDTSFAGGLAPEMLAGNLRRLATTANLASLSAPSSSSSSGGWSSSGSSGGSSGFSGGGGGGGGGGTSAGSW